MKVIVDSNILVYAAKKKIDLFNQIKDQIPDAEILVPNLVIKELEKLSEKAKKGSDKQAAKLALQIIKFSKVKTLKLEGYADKAIINWAKKNKAIVATYDHELKRKLRDEGIAVFGKL